MQGAAEHASERTRCVSEGAGGNAASAGSAATTRAREGSPCATARGVNTTARTLAGFQLQRNARTVQGELEAALARLNGGERVVVDGAGRTDAGVHATGQVIAFTYRGRRLPAAVLQRAVNALLPRDVAIRDLRRAPDGFHPRYAARYREYRYTVWNGPRSPLRERQALGVRATAEHRRHGGRRGRSSRAGTTSRPSADDGPVARSGPCTRSGSGRRAAW